MIGFFPMEVNNRSPAQGDGSSVDWRTQIQPDARQRVVDKIMETLKVHLPISLPEGLNELRKIAIRFEEKVHTDATSRLDYLRKIALKMVSMEIKAQQSQTNQAMPSAGVVNQNSADPGSHNIQPQANSPGQQLPVPDRQSLLAQNVQNASSAAIQDFSLHQQQNQQLGSQSNLPGLQQQQQHPQLLETLPNVLNMQPHRLALIMQNNTVQHQQLHQQQQNQQSSLTMSQCQAQSQHQASQQQLISQFQSPPTQIQQQFLMQQQLNSLQWEMQLWLQASTALLQTQNTMEQEQFIQTQKGLPEGSSSTSVDSKAQTGHAGAVDPLEECFQKLAAIRVRENQLSQEIAKLQWRIRRRSNKRYCRKG